MVDKKADKEKIAEKKAEAKEKAKNFTKAGLGKLKEGSGGFMQFIREQNVVGLAVGLILGTAASGLVNSSLCLRLASYWAVLTVFVAWYGIWARLQLASTQFCTMAYLLTILSISSSLHLLSIS